MEDKNFKRPYISKSLIIFLILLLILYRRSRIFSLEKWQAEPEKRVNIVHSLLKTAELDSMTKDEIEAYLGSQDLEESPYGGQDRLVYGLGLERALISEAREYLILYFEDEKLVHSEIKKYMEEAGDSRNG